MMSRSLVLAAMTAVGATTALLAQDRPLPSVPQSLGLQEAVELANQNNPLYRQTQNDRGPAAWGVRSALASTFLPNFTVSGGVQYSGPGSQTFLAASFQQLSGTLASSYSLSLNWQLSGQTLSQPGLARAQLAATDAAITGARMNLRSALVNQYLGVRQAQDGVRIAEAQQKSAEEALRLAQARYQVGQTTVLDVRQAEVLKGRADVALIQAQQLVTVEKLRLFQQMGVGAPDDPSVVSLTDTFPVVEPTWDLQSLLTEAEEQNPDLNSLEARHNAAVWNERAVKSSWLPTFSFAAGWTWFQQHFTDLDPMILNSTAAALEAAASSLDTLARSCQYINSDLLNPGRPLLTCPAPTLSAADSAIIIAGAEQAVRTRNQTIGLFDFNNYTRQPFFARVGVSFPIFTQFSRPLRAAEAGAQADDARELVRARSLQVRTDVSQAHYGVQTAYRTIAIQETNRSAAQEGLRLATEQYRVGSATFLNVLDAQAVAQQAEADYVRAVYDYHRAIVQLETAVGRSLR
ncbi:MAG TPA: TolC family protein [Gemmatimonadales bacterium]|jgi:outer membrane protein TolC|nr:TolC family protein [Gemmatimonadales bacterium]